MTHDQAIAQLKQLENGAKEAMRAGELKVANEIVQDAKSNAPGSLPSGIFTTQNSEETTIHGGHEIAAYVEFGTGNFAKEYVASLPKEAQEEALKFFVTGKGRNHEYPFFFPAIFRHQEEILSAVEDELNKLVK